MDVIASYVETLMPAHEKAFNYHTIFGKEVRAVQIVDAATRIPMGAPRTIIVLKEAQSLADIQNLINYVDRPTPSTNLFIFYKKKADKRKAIFKKLTSTHSNHECKPLYDNQVPRWLQGYLADLGLQANPEAISLLSEYLGNSLSKQADAIEKLQLNLDEGQMITGAAVRKLIGINKDYDIFALQSALASKDLTKAHRIIRYYVSNAKNAPLVLIVTNLFRFFSELLHLRSIGATSEPQIKAASQVRNLSAIRDMSVAMRYYSPRQLKKAVAILHEYDLRSKGYNTRSTSHDAFLKELVVKLMA